MDGYLNKTGYGIVIVTASSQQEAEAIACSLVEAKLAACVSLMPIHSIFSWQGELRNEPEWQLLIKKWGLIVAIPIILPLILALIYQVVRPFVLGHFHKSLGYLGKLIFSLVVAP